MFSDTLTIDCSHSCQAVTTQKTSGHTSDCRKTCHSLSTKQTKTGKNQFLSSSQFRIFPNEISFICFHSSNHHRRHHRESQSRFQSLQPTIFERKNAQVHLVQVRKRRIFVIIAIVTVLSFSKIDICYQINEKKM